MKYPREPDARYRAMEVGPGGISSDHLHGKKQAEVWSEATAQATVEFEGSRVLFVPSAKLFSPWDPGGEGQRICALDV